MQIVNTSSTLGSIGNKEPLLANDEARRGNAFAWGAVAYNMSKAGMNMRELPDSSSTSISQLGERGEVVTGIAVVTHEMKCLQHR